MPQIIIIVFYFENYELNKFIILKILSVLGGPVGHALPDRVAASETSSSHGKAEGDESQPATRTLKKRPAADTEHRPLGGSSNDDDDEDTSGMGGSGQNDEDDDDEKPVDMKSKKRPATAVKKKPAKRTRAQETHQVIFSLISLSKIIKTPPNKFLLILVSYIPNSGHRRTRIMLDLWLLVKLWLKLDLVNLWRLKLDLVNLWRLKLHLRLLLMG